MRHRAFVSLLLLALVPGLVDAQRIPTRGGRGGIGGGLGGAEPPPMAPAIARQMAYHRLPLSIESYPMISYMNAPSYATDGVAARWTTFGAGTRMDYRFTRFASVTFDMTSSMVGGPLQATTAELGTRLHRERTESRAFPFVDFRVGYAQAFNNAFPSINGIAIPGAQQTAGGLRFSRGFGAVAGTGTEFALSRQFAATVGAWATRSNMTGYRFGSSADRRDFMMNSVRLTFGLVYNPVRYVRRPS